MTGPLELVDYGRLLGGRSTPARRDGKFVLIRGPEALYLVLGHRSFHSHHVHIVERFCAFPPGPTPACEIDAKSHAARFRDDGWEILGGGAYRIDEAARELLVGGRSVAFGACDVPGLADLVSASPPASLEGFDVHEQGRP